MRLDDVSRLARERLAAPEYLSSLVLCRGAGSGAPGCCCGEQEVRRVMSGVAIELGYTELAHQLNPESDLAPPGTSEICRVLLIAINDASPKWREEIIAILNLVPGSGDDEALELRRACRLFDWTVREALPACLDALGDAEAAAVVALLRALPPVLDDGTAEMCIEPLRLARAHAIARIHATRVHAIGFGHVVDLALGRAIVRAIDMAIDIAHARILARHLALNLARVVNIGWAKNCVCISPVPLLRELLEMKP